MQKSVYILIIKYMEDNMAKVAVLGYGTVGSGVVEILNTNAESILKKAGESIEVKSVLDLRDFPGDPVQEKIVHDIDLIINDDEIDVVVEVMGGVEPAFTFVKRALEAGKSVCTSNKALVAAHGAELLAMAKKRSLNFMFEASVGGGIPIIRPLNQALTADEITKITGIMNGTTNYILTKMSNEGSSYQEVLKEAQELGYAERNPEADVEGYDAGRKMAIMSSIAFNSRVTFNQVYTEGITKITAEDIKYAKEFGYVIKLLGLARNTPDGIEVKVHPMLIDENHPLATVRDSFNAVFVHGEASDDTMFMGRGAGQMPTASAVMGDIIDVCRNIVHGSCGKIGCSCYKELPVKDISETKSKFFLRIEALDKQGVLANIASVLGNNDVSIAQVVQKSRKDGVAELVIITDVVAEKNFNDAMTVFNGLSVVKEIAGVIRVY